MISRFLGDKHRAGKRLNPDAAVQYLLHASQATDVQIISGDPSLFIDVAAHGAGYTSGVLSFDIADTNKITPDVVADIITDWETWILAGIPASSAPELLWVYHHEADGRRALHFLIPHTGPKDWWPYIHHRDISGRRAVCRYLRAKHDLADPDTPNRQQLVKSGIDWTLAKGRRDIAEAIDRYIIMQAEAAIDAKMDYGRGEVLAAISDLGLTVKRVGKNYISVLVPGHKKALRLKGAIYREQWRFSKKTTTKTKSTERRTSQTRKRSIAKLHQRYEDAVAHKANWVAKRCGKNEQPNKTEYPMGVCYSYTANFNNNYSGIPARPLVRKQNSRSCTDNTYCQTDAIFTRDSSGRGQPRASIDIASPWLDDRLYEIPVRCANMQYSQNTETEIECLKKTVSIVDFAKYTGWHIDQYKPPAAIIMLTRAEGDQIIVSRNIFEYDIYCDAVTGQGGSVIDFTLQYAGATTLTEAVWLLRPWLLDSAVPYPISPQDRHRPLLTNTTNLAADWVHYNNQSPDIIAPNSNSQVSICQEVLRRDKFRKCWMQEKTHPHNMLFPHQDSSGQLLGFEIYGKNYKGFSPGGIEGIWASANIESAANIVVCDNPPECLAYEQLFSPGHDTAYIAINTNFAMPRINYVLDVIGIGAAKVAGKQIDNYYPLAAQIKQYTQSLSLRERTKHIVKAYSYGLWWEDNSTGVKTHVQDSVISTTGGIGQDQADAMAITIQAAGWQIPALTIISGTPAFRLAMQSYFANIIDFNSEDIAKGDFVISEISPPKITIASNNSNPKEIMGNKLYCCMEETMPGLASLNPPCTHSISSDKNKHKWTEILKNKRKLLNDSNFPVLSATKRLLWLLYLQQGRGVADIPNLPDEHLDIDTLICSKPSAKQVEVWACHELAGICNETTIKIDNIEECDLPDLLCQVLTSQGVSKDRAIDLLNLQHDQPHYQDGKFRVEADGVFSLVDRCPVPPELQAHLHQKISTPANKYHVIA